MSFRSLSLLFIVGLLSCVLLLQWWSIRTFTEDVTKQVGESAFEVSRSTAETLILDRPKIQFQSMAFAINGQSIESEEISQAVSSIRQDVVLQLVDEQKDDFIMLNSDGTEFQIPIPRTGIHNALDGFANNVLYSTLGLLISGILLAIYFTKKLSTPLSNLQLAARQIGDGELGTQIKKQSQWHTQEIESTVNAFNHMSRKIQELSKSNEALQSKVHLAELAEISRGLAHTIRNPLNTLNLAIDELEVAEKIEQRENLSRMAKKQIQRIDRWVRSMMELMSSDKSLLAKINLNELLKNLLQELKLSLTSLPNIQLDYRASTQEIIAIEPELKSLLLNIINNAIEVSERDQQVVIIVEDHKGSIKNSASIKITVEDQGPGFDKAILDKLFTPHNTNKTYGAGMGLYLTERVIKHKYSGEVKIANLYEITDNLNPDNIAESAKSPDNQPKGSQVTLLLNDRGE